MIAVKLSGGLGNQMFQYALYLALRERGYTVKIDEVSGYGPEEKLRHPELREAFPDTLPSYETAADEEIRKLRDAFMDPASRIRRKLTGRKSKEFAERTPYRYDPVVIETNDRYLNGWWQSPRYFSDNETKVRAAFDLSRTPLGPAHRDALERILAMRREESLTPVAVHVRRGDYLEKASYYGGICTGDYYRNGLAAMREKYGACRFLVFTNDAGWNGDGMLPPDAEILRLPEEGSGVQDMALMAACTGQIIANSSFSWWAAYLAHGDPWKCGSAGHNVILPDHFDNRYPESELAEPWMTVVGSGNKENNV